MFRGLFGGRARRHYARGIERYDEGELEEAIRSFTEAVAADPDGPDAALARFYRADAQARLGIAALDSGDPAAALSRLDAALEENGRFPDLHTARAAALLALDDPLAAEHAARRALELNEDFVEAAAVVVLALDAQGSVSRADEMASLWTRRASGQGHPLAADFTRREGLAVALQKHRQRRQERRRAVERAEGCLREGFWAEASGLLQDLVDETPDYPDLRLRLAAARLGENALPEAQAEIARALEINPEFADAHVLAGILALRQERVGVARGHFDAAGRNGRGSVAALYGLVVCALRGGEFLRALNGMNRLAGEDLPPEDARALHAVLEFLVGRVASARERFEALLAGTRRTGLLVDIMEWALTAGATDLAHEALRRIDDGDRTAPDVVRAHARLRAAEGAPERARELCESALLATPRHEGLLLDLAGYFATLDEGEAGLRCLLLREARPPAGLHARLLRLSARRDEAAQVLADARAEDDPATALELLYLARAADDADRARALLGRHGADPALAWRLQDPARWLGPLRPWPAAVAEAQRSA